MKKARDESKSSNGKGEDIYMTVREVATLLRTTPKSIYNQVAGGSMPGVRRFGSRLLFNRAEVIKCVEGTKADEAEAS